MEVTDMSFALLPLQPEARPAGTHKKEANGGTEFGQEAIGDTEFA